MTAYKDPNVRKAIAVLLLEKDTQCMGTTVRSVTDQTRISANAAQCALQSLVDEGFVEYRTLQVGTGGTSDTFYTIKEGVNVALTTSS